MRCYTVVCINFEFIQNQMVQLCGRIFLTSSVFSMVQCRLCSVIASESEVSVVVPEIAE